MDLIGALIGGIVTAVIGGAIILICFFLLHLIIGYWYVWLPCLLAVLAILLIVSIWKMVRPHGSLKQWFKSLDEVGKAHCGAWFGISLMIFNLLIPVTFSWGMLFVPFTIGAALFFVIRYFRIWWANRHPAASSPPLPHNP